MRNDAKLGIAAAAVTMAAILVWWALRGDPEQEDAPGPEGSSGEIARQEPPSEDTPGVDDPAPPEDKEEAPGVPGLVLHTVAGQVRDLDGAPVVGVRVTFEPADPAATTTEPFRATTDEQGAFQLSRPSVAGRLVLQEDQYLTVQGRALGAEPPGEPVALVMARRADLKGKVLVEEDRAAVGARIELHLPSPVLERARAIDGMAEWERRTTTSADGDFRMDSVAVCEEARLEVWQEGYLPTSLTLAQAIGQELVVRLRPEVTEAAPPTPPEETVVSAEPPEEPPEAPPAEPPAPDVESLLPCRFQLFLEGRFAEADEIRLLDAAGHPLPIAPAAGAEAGSSAPLEGGRTAVLRSTEAARTLILIRDGDDYLRLPLRLWSTDRVRTIRL